MKPSKLAPLFLFVLTLSLTGCASTGWNPFTMIFGRKAAAVAKTQAKIDTTTDNQSHAAHVEAFKTSVALKVAAAENPNSLSVKVALRTNTNAVDLLNQISPLTTGEMQDAVLTINGLMSADAVARAEAERKQLLTEEKNNDLSSQLDKYRALVKVQNVAAAAEAADNLSLANKYRLSVIWTWAGTIGSLALGALAIAYKLNIGGLQSGIAEALAKVEATHGAAAADTARSALDAVLNSGQQQGVAQAFFAVQQAAIPSTPAATPPPAAA